MDGVRARKQLKVAITYKRGVAQTELAEGTDSPGKTVYNWLRRFEADSILTAASETAPTGHSPKLDQREDIEDRYLSQETPENTEYDAKE
ncbi:hypothetical protein [Haladaptatus halobius]|uniref:hypothetical protein n=1 Tax=Haladaptatus halobius TaxID=2884875 RepID=UPI001D0ABCAE|nr:hypothetical protein [Haladaptatus halobius]